MNCATHNDVEAVAYCRTCGKALCPKCAHGVRGVIYCEDCLAARLEGVQPPQTPYQQVMDQGLGIKVAPGPTSGPNPTVAGILAGFFPIGVGAVYTGQYAKGLSHLVIMVLLIIGVGSDLPWYVTTVLGILIGFFYVYQIIDAVRSAKALQMGEPVPDPFGLAATFGAGERFEGTKVPAGAAVLIGLGVIFLLHTAGLFEFGLDRFWPLILIFLGVWAFARQWGLIGGRALGCQCDHCRTRKLMFPAIMVTLGVLFLLDSTSRIGFGRTWPAILLVIGVVKLMHSNSSSSGHVGPLPVSTTPPYVPPSGPPTIVQPPAPENPERNTSSGEVKNV